MEGIYMTKDSFVCIIAILTYNKYHSYNTAKQSNALRVYREI